MKRIYMLKRVCFALATMIVLSFFNIHSSAKMLDGGSEVFNTYQFGVKTCEGNPEINQYILDHVNDITDIVINARSSFTSYKTIGDTLFISNPFIIQDPNNTDDILTNQGTYYAVISNNEVICVIVGFLVDNAPHYSIMDLYSDELSEFCRDNLDRELVFDDSLEDSSYRIEAVSNNVRSTHSSEDIVFIDLSDCCNEAHNVDGMYFMNQLFVGQTAGGARIGWEYFTETNCPGRGFLINTDTEKVLNTNYCLALQGNYLCAYPCIATLYNYRTARLEMNSETAYNYNNALGHFDVTTTAGQVGLINMLMPVAAGAQYKVYYGGVISQFYTMHNINNTFPMILGGHTYPTYTAFHVHLIIGYQRNPADATMRWCIYNPWTPGYVLWTEYTGDGVGHFWYGPEHAQDPGYIGADSQVHYNQVWIEDGLSAFLY